MDRRDPEVVAIVKKLKDEARASPWIPAGAPPHARYHHLPNEISLCFTRDLFSKKYINRLAQAIGTKIPEELGEGGQFWHLSIARLGARGPTPEEIEFWRRAFFEEEPIIEVPGLIGAVNSRHFFWRADLKVVAPWRSVEGKRSPAWCRLWNKLLAPRRQKPD